MLRHKGTKTSRMSPTDDRFVFIDWQSSGTQAGPPLSTRRLIAEERLIARLLKVFIWRKGSRETALLHDHERDAIRQAPFLIETRLIKLEYPDIKDRPSGRQFPHWDRSLRRSGVERWRCDSVVSQGHSQFPAALREW